MNFKNIYMDKELIKDKIYQIIDQFNERKTISTKFFFNTLNKVNPYYDGNGRKCKIQFANEDI